MAKSREETTNRAISLIFSVSRMIKEKYRNERQENISGVKLETLRYIKENKPLMKDIAEYLSVAPPSATSLINHLVEAKLVERIRDGNDRRIVRMNITSFGEKKFTQGMTMVADRMKKVLSPLNASEKENLIKILEKISRTND
ncbi:MAG: MarR family transcriptional regulator [Candidatus Moranbacteria bacterium]|nr:MarR family transcriptional regulator [Candidatus Moranbacteria bacterium]